MTDPTDIHALLHSLARADLESFGGIAPRLGACAAGVPLAIFSLRPHPKGEYHLPLLEVLAAFRMVGADHYVFATGGKVWSLRDPIPPVDAAGDLRQKVFMTVEVRSAGEVTTHRTVLHPFDGDASPEWGDPVTLDGEIPEGWIPQVLEVAAKHAEVGLAEEVMAQLARCDEAGHELVMPPDELLLRGGPGGELLWAIRSALEFDDPDAAHADGRQSA